MRYPVYLLILLTGLGFSAAIYLNHQNAIAT
ncbi:MAG: hypothetical protein QOG27_1674, partial [Verrucomicrobiota bacterium]